MKNIVYILSCMFMFINGYAQLVDLPGEYIRQKIVGNNGIPNNVEGSPFYIDEFKEGTIYTNDDKSFKADLRYDAYNDEIQMKQNEGIIALLKFDKGKAEIGNKVYQVYTYFNEDKGEDNKGYFINLTKSGNIQLLQHKRKIFVEGRKAQNSYSTDKPPMFRDEISYYLLKDSSIILVKLSKKPFLKLLKDKKVELDNYISDNKLKLKKDKDFI